ncbi:MAG: clostripain-related cysteine peptidase [Anaerolineae bacterium]
MRFYPVQQKLRFWTVLVVVGIVLANCPPSAYGQTETAQWTVLLYYAADNNLEPVIMRELNRIEMIGSTPEVNFVALVDRHPRYWTGSDNWSDTRLLHIEKDNNLFTITSPVVRKLGEINTGSAETLERFIAWGITTYPAQRYALVISDHGGGWQGAASDETSKGEMISPAGLAQALEKGLHTAAVDRLDLLIFDACLMAQLEVWSLLSPYVRYGVASEEITYGLKGFDRAMRDLTDHPEMKAEELGTRIVQYFEESYTDDETGNTLTMSEIDLDQVLTVQRAIDHLAQVLSAEADSPETILAVARGLAHSPSFADIDREFFGMIDLRSFLLIVEALGKNSQVVEAAQQARAALEKAVPTHYAGQDIPSAGGLSFFFPTWPRLVAIYVDGYQDVLDPMPGAKQSPWVQFLGLYPNALKRVVDEPVVAPLQLNREAIAEGERAQVTTTVSGIGLREVELIAGRVEGEMLIVLDSNRLILREREIEEGLKVPVWDDQRNPMRAWWNGNGWVLSNGERSVRVSIHAIAPGSDTFAVPGYFRSVAGGAELEGELRYSVDVESGEAAYMGAFARQENGLLGPYFFEAGDTFTVKRQVIRLADGKVEGVRGGALIIGQEPPQLLNAAVPAGMYQFGVRAVNLAGGSALQLTELQMVGGDTQPQLYRSRPLSFATLQPVGWLVEETVGTVTFTPDDLSAVKAQVGVIPLARLGIVGRQPLEQILPALLDVLSADEQVSNVQPGQSSATTLADHPARRLDYTYLRADSGPISGSLVAFIDSAREQLFVSISEAPTRTLAEEQAALDLVRDNLELLPTMFSNRVYSNQVMGFSLSYNDYWQVIEQPAGGDVFFHTPAGDAALRVQVRSGKRQPEPQDNDAQLFIYVEDWLRQQPDLKVTRPTDVQMSGLSGRQLTYSFQDEEGKTFEGSVAAVTTRDGRVYILNSELDTSSPELDLLQSDLRTMLDSFTIVDPDASPVPLPGEEWLIYENPELHFGVAYLDILEVEEDLSNPEFRAVKFSYQDLIGIEIAVVPLAPDTPPGLSTADRLVRQRLEQLRTIRPDLQTGTIADMELGDIPARGISYGWYDETATTQGEGLEMEGSILAAPTPYGFAYIVDVYLPISLTDDAPVDANVVPYLLGTFTPLLEGLRPVASIDATGQLLRFYSNTRLGVRLTVPRTWRLLEEGDQIVWIGTDEIGRPMPGYQLGLALLGQEAPLSQEEMDGILGQIIEENLGAAENTLRPLRDAGQPADVQLGGFQGRDVTFLAVHHGSELVRARYVILQDGDGTLYLVNTLIPVTLTQKQKETMMRVLESLELGRE